MQEVDSVRASFNLTNSITIINNNEKFVFNRESEKFQHLLEQLNLITENSHDMPAFGVSLDNLTREELKSGLWLELEFETVLEFNEMPFDALLIKVEKDNSGFNLIRRYKGKYEGRCFYLSLENTMNDLYEEMVL